MLSQWLLIITLVFLFGLLLIGLIKGLVEEKKHRKAKKGHSKQPRVRRNVHTTPGTITNHNMHDIHERNTLLSSDTDGGLNH